MKGGALAVCPNCGHVPTESADRAKHILVSDHKLSQAQLEQSSAEIRRGDVLRLDPEEVQRWETMLAGEAEPTRRGGRKAALLLAVLLLLAGAVWLALQLVG
ncbi:MAG: hypothetical protein ACE5JG_09150 [Planctomycetota bacterium]